MPATALPQKCKHLQIAPPQKALALKALAHPHLLMALLALAHRDWGSTTALPPQTYTESISLCQTPAAALPQKCKSTSIASTWMYGAKGKTQQGLLETSTEVISNDTKYPMFTASKQVS